MAFTVRGNHPVRSKIVLSNRTNKHVQLLYLECSLLYEKDVAIKVSKFVQIIRIINQDLKPSKVQKQTRLWICKTLAVPLYCMQ